VCALRDPRTHTHKIDGLNDDALRRVNPVFSECFARSFHTVDSWCVGLMVRHD